MFQRIVYSEGDYVYQEPECIQFLKQSVLKMVDMFAIEDKKTKVGVKREKGGLISAKMDKAQKRQKLRGNSSESPSSDGNESYRGSGADSEDPEDDEIYHSNSDDKISENEFSDSNSSNSEFEKKKKTNRNKQILNHRHIDFDLLSFVFEFVIQRYYRLKKSAKEGQQGLASEEKPHEVDSLQPVAFENGGNVANRFENTENIVGIVEIKRRNEIIIAKKDKVKNINNNNNKSKDYNKLSLKETILRMKQENSEEDDSSSDDEEARIHAGAVSDEDGGATVGLAVKKVVESEPVNALLMIFQKDCVNTKIDKQKNQFQVWRADQMNLHGYAQFEQCRQQNLMSRGRQVFQNFVRVSISDSAESAKKGIS